MSLCLNKKIEAELRALPGNNICSDCKEKSPQWASVSFGIFMCLECSGRHRALGVHISFVRSVNMDSWNEKQIKMMRIGGNAKSNAFLARYGVPKETLIPQKYNHPAALFYREMISAEVNGQPIPTPPEKFDAAPIVANKAGSSNATITTAGGAQVSESEQEYIAREMRTREEARERMRKKFGGSTGLSSSGGVMTGIGSDANYSSNSSNNSGNSNVDIAVTSSKAFSFLSSSLSLLGEQVVKTTQKIIDETSTVVAANNNTNSSNNNNNNGNSSSSSTGTSSGSNSNNNSYSSSNRQQQPPQDTGAGTGVEGGGGEGGGAAWQQNTWSLLSSAWKNATEATTEMLQSIQQPDDEAFKFPRPLDNSTTNNNSGNNDSQSAKPPSIPQQQQQGMGRKSSNNTAYSNPMYAGSGSTGSTGSRAPSNTPVESSSNSKAVSSSSSCDSLSDLLPAENNSEGGGKGGGGGRRGGVSSTIQQQQQQQSLSLAQLSLHQGNNSNDSFLPKSVSRSSLASNGSGNGSGQTPPPSALQAATSSPGMAGGGGKGSAVKAKREATPVGDDFFATFGV